VSDSNAFAVAAPIPTAKLVPFRCARLFRVRLDEVVVEVVVEVDVDVLVEVVVVVDVEVFALLCCGVSVKLCGNVIPRF